MKQIQLALASALDAGRCVYVHCRMGIGRTGTVLGCRLVEQGLTGEAALAELNRAWQQCNRARQWSSIPETREQRQFVAAWKPDTAAVD
jgi:protein-tyrosine phosphatase